MSRDRTPASPEEASIAVMPPRLLFVVESGTDVRLVQGLAEMSSLTVLARRIEGGMEINQPTNAAHHLEVGPASFSGFARYVFHAIRRRRADFDVVLVQGYGASAAAANAAGRFSRIPVAMLVCSPVEEYYRCRKVAGDPGKPFRTRELTALRLLARVNARSGSPYVVLSTHLAETVRAHGARGRIEVVPVYGVDTGAFCESKTPMVERRRARRLPENGSVVFFSSRIAPEKDMPTLLSAFRLLCDEGRDVFLLNRSGGFRRFLEAARRAGLANRVIATDAVHPHEELPLDYAASSLCVQASRAEGLGYSVLEALACGVPVVAAKVGGLAETVIDGDTGWTYPAGDARGLARAIAEALDNPAEARRRAKAGRRMVEERFERARVFAALAGLIDDLRH